jgi:hypothetical protein
VCNGYPRPPRCELEDVERSHLAPLIAALRERGISLPDDVWQPRRG